MEEMSRPGLLAPRSSESEEGGGGGLNFLLNEV